MADLPPGFQIPTPKPLRPERPLGVSIAAWILVAAGAITGLGGLVVALAGGAATTARPLGLAYLAFGAAELVTGLALRRLLGAFRPFGVVIAVVGILIDVSWVVSGSRWQVVAVLAHGYVAYALATSPTAFGPGGRLA